MVQALMYLVKNLPKQFANMLLYIFGELDIVDFFTYVFLISGVLLVIYFIDRPVRRLSGK